MIQLLSNWKVIRENILKTMDGLTLEQLVTVPVGFNNHLLWNACHVLVTQQLLVYKLSNQEMLIDEVFVERYRKGTFPPDEFKSASDLKYFEERFLSMVDRLSSDLKEHKFSTYNEYSTSFGVTLKNTNEAMAFNNLHESMHLGYMMAMKHAL